MGKKAVPSKNIDAPEPVDVDELKRPEDLVDKSTLSTRDRKYDLKHNVDLKEDDNGTRGEKHVITCVCCGKPKYEDYFYLNRSSFVFGGVWNRVPVCKDCLDSLYRRFSLQYDQLASAAAVIAIADMPYIESHVNTKFEDGEFRIGQYMRSQNLVGLKNKTFIDSIASGVFFDAKDKIRNLLLLSLDMIPLIASVLRMRITEWLLILRRNILRMKVFFKTHTRCNH